MFSTEAIYAKQKYQGDIAKGYDEKREGTTKRESERLIIEAMLQEFPVGTVILDAPVGTGWLIPFFEKQGFVGYGLDINQDMLDQADEKAGEGFDFAIGSVTDIPLDDESVDVSLMIRMTRWLAPYEVQQAIRELQRVTRRRIIFNARVANSPHARSRSLIKSAINANWTIEKEVAIEKDFLMFQLGRSNV